MDEEVRVLCADSIEDSAACGLASSFLHAARTWMTFLKAVKGWGQILIRPGCFCLVNHCCRGGGPQPLNHSSPFDASPTVTHSKQLPSLCALRSIDWIPASPRTQAMHTVLWSGFSPGGLAAAAPGGLGILSTMVPGLGMAL